MRKTATKACEDLLGGDTFPECTSPSLRFSKFLKVGDTTKKGELEAVAKCKVVEKCKAATKEKEKEKEKDVFLPKGAHKLYYKLKAPMMVNMAGGILENAGLCLHPHFGAPYIPGSAVKGVTRHAAWCEWNEAEGERKAALAQTFLALFGSHPDEKDDTPFRQGAVAFLDAVPEENKYPLALEVCTCHHPKYYSGKESEASDNEDPNPQFFLAVKPELSFTFRLAPLRNCPEELLNQAEAWLHEALTVHGIGAKTAAGYGWFEKDEGRISQDERERKEKEQKAREKTLKEELEKLEQKQPLDAADLEWLAKTNADQGLSQELRDRAKRLIKANTPEESPLDKLRKRWQQWEGKDCDALKKAIPKDPDLKNFAKSKNREDIVTLLLEPNTVGSRILKLLKSGIAKFGPQSQEILAAVKAKNGGKLP